MTDDRGDIRRTTSDPDPAGAGGVSRDSLDRLFDRDLSAEERRALVSGLRHDAGALDEVVQTRRMIGLLREPMPTPDLTSAVLDGVARRRGFLSARLRRRVRGGRAMAAAVLALSIGVVGLAHRLYPGRFSLERPQTPVTDLGDAVRQDSAETRLRIEEAFLELGRVEIGRSQGEVVPVDPAAPSLSLASFHIESASEDGGWGATAYRVSVLTGSDAEVLAVGCLGCPPAPWVDVASAADALDDQLLVDGGPLGPPALPDGPVFSASVRAGVLPLSAMPGVSSAYVGRLDVLRDDALEADLRASLSALRSVGPQPRPAATAEPVAGEE